MKADKTKISRLLKTAKGQIEGILRMVEDDKYCIDIATQIMASNAILRKTAKEVLKAHMRSCVVNSFEKGSKKEKEEKLEEVMFVLDKLNK